MFPGNLFVIGGERSAILQMMGRAGRPGFDSSGVAVVMTSQVSAHPMIRTRFAFCVVTSSTLISFYHTKVVNRDNFVPSVVKDIKPCFLSNRCFLLPVAVGILTR